MTRHEHERGSYTIEVSMIFTLIVFVILTLMFTFLYMQQKAGLVRAASFAAQQGAELWLDSRKSIWNGEVDRSKAADSVGYRVFDNLLFTNRTYEGYIEETKDGNGRKKLVLRMDTGNNLPGKKVRLIGEALCEKIDSTVLKPKNTRLRITYTNNALRGRLTVEIIQEIKVPLGGLKALFDGKATMTLRAYSTAAVSEPDEYIRNIDLAMELSKRLGDRLDFKGLLDNIRTRGRK